MSLGTRIYPLFLLAAMMLPVQVLAQESRITSISNPSVMEGDVGTTTMTFVLTCSCDLAVNATVNWQLNDGTATVADNDYVDVNNGMLTVVGGTGVEEYQINVTINGDTAFEPDETLELELTGASVGSPSFFLDDTTATGTILNDDVQSADTGVAITDMPDPVTAGSGADNLTYTFTVTNNGPADATGVSASVTLNWPVGVTVGTGSPSQGTVPPGFPATWDIGALANGASATLTYDLTVALSAPEGADQITASANVAGSDQPDLNGANDADTDGTTIVWPEATFNVQKVYTGDDGGAITATLSCSDTSGLLVYDPQQGTTPTALTVRRFDDGGTSCTVTESDVPGGFFVADRSAGCDVDPVTDGGAYECTITNANTRATFEVTKDFTDDNPSEVEMTISCNTGIVIEQSQGVSESRSVEFVVIAYDDGELACEITEEDLAGYNVSYDDGTPDSTSCSWEGIAGGAELTCAITNTPAPVDVVINKDWVFEGTTDGEGIDLRYELTLFCDAEIVDGEQLGGLGVEAPAGNGPSCGFVLFNQEGPQGFELTDWCKAFVGEGPSDAVHVAEVIPEYPDSNCYVVENVFDNAVEVDNGCTSLTVSAGQGDSCTVTNTVFFEGIPTLNQHGLAVLALLMLGIGFVGFRRFA